MDIYPWTTYELARLHRMLRRAVRVDREPAGSGTRGGPRIRLAREDGCCTDARLVFSAALDGEPAASEEALAAARHLCGCTACAEFVAWVTVFTHELRTGSVEPSGLGTRARSGQ